MIGVKKAGCSSLHAARWDRSSSRNSAAAHSEELETMPRRPKSAEGDATEILRDILIVQLGVAVPHQTIGAIVGCDINRVGRVVRH